MEDINDINRKYFLNEYHAMQFIKSAMLIVIDKINENESPGKNLSIEIEQEEIFNSDINQTEQGIFLVCKDGAPYSFWSPFGEYKFVKSVSSSQRSWSIGLPTFFEKLKKNGVVFENADFEGKDMNGEKFSPIFRIIATQDCNLPKPLLKVTLKPDIARLNLKKANYKKCLRKKSENE